MYHECKDDEKISYLDFISLYPSVQKSGKYPVDHPKIITSNFEDISSYFGIIKCQILPPQDLWLPVLPIHSNGKLVFPLCRTCATEQNKEKCKHSIPQRAIEGTWVSLEINKAIEMGYKILYIYEVYHWNKWSQYNIEGGEKDLFVDYVNQAVKEKVEASGFPESCVTDKEKDIYIDDFFKAEGNFKTF